MAKKKVGLEGFKQFIQDAGVVGFAVAFVIGGAVADFVSKFLEAIVSPVVAAVMGGSDIANSLTSTVGDATLRWGSAIQALIDFLIIALVIYAMVKITGADEWDNK